MNKKNGISMIVLIITMIVMVIITTATIMFVAGDNGIINQANEAVSESNKSVVKEIIQFAIYDVYSTGEYDVTGESLAKFLKNYDSPDVTYNQIENVVMGTLNNLKYKIDIETLEVTFVDEFEDTYKLPDGFTISTHESQDQTSEGLVAIDEDKNEWVWIVVPKSIYITASSATDYNNIENDINLYTLDYKSQTKEGYEYKDQYIEGTLKILESEDEYNTLKNNVLNSIYTNGGFWISRYEIGIGASSKASSLPNLTVHMYIEPYDAQKKAKEMNENGTLMFGFQWDLMLKFMEKSVGSDVLLNDSTSIGWYTTTIHKTGIPNPVNGNMILNIYDIAGNAWEWTLETSTDVIRPFVMRGGSYYNEGNINPASFRNDFYGYNNNIGYRVSIY